MIKSCPTCNASFETEYAMQKHRRGVHPETIRKFTKKSTQGPVMEKFQQGEQLIREALREVDAERTIIQKKLLELDDIAAKYNKLLNPNGGRVV